MSRNLRRWAAACTVLSVGCGSIASTKAESPGSDDQSAVLAEIVVTAQRREEKLSDVPMSIQAFSQESMDKQGIRNVDDLTRLAPGVTFQRNGLSSASNWNDETSDISIRGVDSNFGAATTGIYIDDTPLVFRHGIIGVTPYPAVFDLARVEVLEGPQGTLFGAGSMGGAIRFITPEPSLTTYSGYARAELAKVDGGSGNYEVGAAFGGPIIPDVLGFRVSASTRREGGWVDRADYIRPPSTVTPDGATVYSGLPTVSGITETNANWRETQTFRAALKWRATENLTIDPSIYIQTLHINDTGAYWVDLSNPDDNVYRNGNAQRDPSTDPWYVGAVKISWDLPWAALTSNTSYFRQNQHSVSDYSQWVSNIFLANQYPAVGDVSTTPYGNHQTTVTEEIRLTSKASDAPILWTGGLFYTHAYQNVTAFIHSADLAPATPGYIAYANPIASTLDKQMAVFGEATLKFPADFSLTAGLRYSKLDYVSAFEATAYGIIAGTPSSPDGVPSSGGTAASSKPVTPRAVLKYKPDEEAMYYVSAAKGFRAGSANGQFTPAAVEQCGVQAPASVAPDSVWQYEIGTKNTILNRRLQFSASAYYYKWKGTQQTVYLSCGYSYGSNLGDVIGKGGTVSVAWRPMDSLSLAVIGAYTDAVYQDVVTSPNSSTTVRSGDHLPASPWNVNANAEYAMDVFETHPYLRVDYQFASQQRSLTPANDPENFPNSDPTLPGLPEIRILAIRAGLRFNGIDASLFVQNALNYNTAQFYSRDSVAPYTTSYYARGLAPRTFGVTAAYRF
jgi:iron complex outermembrane recepter protein